MLPLPLLLPLLLAWCNISTMLNGVFPGVLELLNNNFLESMLPVGHRSTPPPSPAARSDDLQIVLEFVWKPWNAGPGPSRYSNVNGEDLSRGPSMYLPVSSKRCKALATSNSGLQEISTFAD